MWRTAQQFKHDLVGAGGNGYVQFCEDAVAGSAGTAENGEQQPRTRGARHSRVCSSGRRVVGRGKGFVGRRTRYGRGEERFCRCGHGRGGRTVLRSALMVDSGNALTQHDEGHFGKEMRRLHTGSYWHLLGSWD